MFNFSTKIKILRQENHLTQEEFGKIFGIVKSTVSMYENGKSIPDDKLKSKIADYFNVSIDWLMGRTDIRNVLKIECDERVAKVIHELGLDVVNKFLELETMSENEKEHLMIFLDGLKARRER